MKKKFSLVIVTLFLIAVMTGCSSKTSKDSENTNAEGATSVIEDSSANETEEASESTTDNGETIAEDSSETAETTDTTEGSVEEDPNIPQVEEVTYPFTYTDAEGREVVIEKKPEKIAINYLPYLEYLIALEQLPVGTIAARHYESTFESLQGYDISSVADLGETEVNLELLAELEPELFMSASYDSGVENLEKVAPVIVLDGNVRIDWRHGLREIGKVIGKAQDAEYKIAEIEELLGAARERLVEEYKDETVMLMSLMGKDRYFCANRSDLFDKETGLGLNAPEGYPQSANYEQVSVEAIVEMNPDYIFLAVFDGNEGIYEELSQNSVWKTLKAVQNNHVYILDGSAHSMSVLSTVYTINTIVDTLLEQ